MAIGIQVPVPVDRQLILSTYYNIMIIDIENMLVNTSNDFDYSTIFNVWFPELRG